MGTSCSTRSSCGVNPPAAGNEAHELVGVEGPVRLPWDGCCCHPDRRVEGDKAALLIVVARDLQHVVLSLARHLRIDQAPVQAAVAQEAFPVALRTYSARRARARLAEAASPLAAVAARLPPQPPKARGRLEVDDRPRFSGSLHQEALRPGELTDLNPGVPLEEGASPVFPGSPIHRRQGHEKIGWLPG